MTAKGTLLITAGPTHEPIDRVRFIGNRSSGRLGIALAAAGASRGLEVTLLLGPMGAEPPALGPPDTPVRIERFRTTADLQALLRRRLPGQQAFIMAAAVADFRPKAAAGVDLSKVEKMNRSAGSLTLELEATPDLLAECAEPAAAAGTMIIGFALEPRDRLRESALRKLERKGAHAIVANPLDTMDAPTIEAQVFWRDGEVATTEGAVAKERFAAWLLDQMERRGAWARKAGA